MNLFKLFVLLTLTFMVSCVFEDTAVEEAGDLFPKCENFEALKHHFGGEKGYSRTKVQMKCPGGTRVEIVKCDFGWGVFSDTTCWKNN
jgi:outer membrane lipoprotein-sorting protein